MLATSLGSWDTVETGQRHRHGLTFPLAILGSVLVEAGYPLPDCWEGDERPAARDYGLLLISAMDSRHFWRVVPWLRLLGCPVRAVDRGETDPIVVIGGQAATAPAPIEPFVDVVYIGEAEAHVADLMRALDATGTRRERLERAAAVPGCLVPACRPAGHVVSQVYATDIGVTLRELLQVNHRVIRRVEIARGCRSKCGFCALGWRTPYRENSVADIEAALRRTREAGIREVILAAGDAESHSGIERIRAVVEAEGMRDHGWTGRLDTMRDCSVSAGKNFAFGIEGLSHRLRRLAGKGRLTNDYIATELEAYWRAGGRRLMLHMIGGLPTETDADAPEFRALLARLAGVAADIGEQMHIEIGRQPFGPLPHTPMQWCAPGLETERIGAISRDFAGGGRLSVTDKSGQRYQDALINAVVMRGGPETVPIVEAGPPRLSEAPALALAEWMLWLRRFGLDGRHYLSAWDPDAPIPWGHVRSAFSVEELRRAHRRIVGAA